MAGKNRILQRNYRHAKRSTIFTPGTAKIFVLLALKHSCKDRKEFVQVPVN